MPRPIPIAPILAAAAATAAGLLASTASQAQEPTPYQAACSGSNPYFVTSCYAQGFLPDEPALVAYRDTPDNSGHIVVANQGLVGSTYGIAYVPTEGAMFVGAYHKRGTAFGPGGPGMIYRVDIATGEVSQWQTVPNAGTDHHDRSGNYWPDTAARNFAGVVGLGDLDINSDGTELYAMNLFDRRIYRYRLADKALAGTIEIGSVHEDWASQARPFALKFWRGKLYHGVVHSAYASQSGDDLAAYVYETEPDGSQVRLVTQFSLDFPRGDAVANLPARWLPWKDGYNAIGPGQLGVYPQPMLTDIEFADNGDMILGFRDRYGDMTFFDPGGRNPPGEGTGIPAGDIVLAHYNGDTWDAQTTPEYFPEDFGPNAGVHDETGFGGLARVTKADVVVTTGLAPLRISSGGAYWFNDQTGANTAREEIYNFTSEVNFGKANGLGDVEIVCGPEEATATPTATASATATAPATVTATPTPPPTVTPTTGPPTITPTSTATVPTTASPTASAKTPTATEESRNTRVPTPAPTRKLPKLPKTGGGATAHGPGGGWGATVALVAALMLSGIAIRRRLWAGDTTRRGG